MPLRHQRQRHAPVRTSRETTRSMIRAMVSAMHSARFMVAVMLALGVASCRSEAQRSVSPPAPGEHSTTRDTSNASASSTANEGQRPVTKGLESFHATLRIDDKAGHKGFQGVWLERQDGKRLLIADRAYGYWKPFAGHQVEVTGERHEPAGEAVMAEHFRVHTLRIDPGKMTSLVRVEAERVIEGKLEERTMEPGTKLAGEKYTYFVSADGTAYLPANALNERPPCGKSLKVKARPVELTPFETRLGGPYLWIIEVLP